MTDSDRIKEIESLLEQELKHLPTRDDTLLKAWHFRTGMLAAKEKTWKIKTEISRPLKMVINFCVNEVNSNRLALKKSSIFRDKIRMMGELWALTAVYKIATSGEKEKNE